MNLEEELDDIDLQIKALEKRKSDLLSKAVTIYTWNDQQTQVVPIEAVLLEDGTYRDERGRRYYINEYAWLSEKEAAEDLLSRLEAALRSWKRSISDKERQIKEVKEKYGLS